MYDALHAILYYRNYTVLKLAFALITTEFCIEI
jgi:hypothetical protein